MGRVGKAVRERKGEGGRKRDRRENRKGRERCRDGRRKEGRRKRVLKEERKEKGKEKERVCVYVCGCVLSGFNVYT